jgi:hypothetical protein
VPSSKRWCFQIGTSALRVSIRAREASNAWPRWAAVVATTTVDVVLRGDPLAHLAQLGQCGGVGGVVEAVDVTAAVVVAHPADEEGEAAGGLVVEGGHHLGDVQRGLAQVHESYDGGHTPDPRPEGANRDQEPRTVVP